MEIHRIMTQYNTKLLNTLNTLEQLSSELLRGIVTRVTDLFNKIVKSMRHQAWTSLAFGLGTGGLSMGATVIPPTAHALAKPLVEGLSKAMPQFGQAATTTMHASETRDNLNQSLMREQHMQEQKELRSKYAESRSREEDNIGKIQDLIARSYQRA